MIAPYMLFFFAGLGAFNGSVLAAYLLLRRPVTPAQRWLAVLILAISIRTGKSVLFYFYPEIPRTVLQVGLTACFLIGPCLVGFVRAWADPAGERTRRDWMVAAGLLAAATGFGAAFPYTDHPQWWGMPVWRGVTYSWLACLLAAVGLYLRAVRRTDPAAAADGIGRGHAAAVIAGVAVVWLAYFTAGLTSYIVGALSFSLVLYLGAVVLLARRQARVAAAPYQDRKIADDEARAALQSLHRLMAEQALYQDARLNLARVARRLNLPPARLSQLLNDNHKTAFKPYLMQLRVGAAKRLLREPGHVAMEHVAEASGFLSMSTFYSSFKKLEGMTPAAWRQAQLAGARDS
ncbi:MULTISPECIES: helix-turn-helix domain-containing protein [unclassified Lysobacter]|uniref:AraC family transcriptional regulator n=1 Tax=unclassified Lysobacter TaxID=2635362 RepID=UPI001BE9A6FB|nr:MULTISPECIES: helix-turn-helix domain-containing protein [unclassified Lysobacter]MBT2748709.1 AraC family transcriptional regulator [Lysobacter sp. ISL-42]MBT2751644.1 AraC family transcriptional regulator [Lysobacter sp. ISL-50]MBT2775838.1 AraC family transcriptional regulator [Lysobacter sp. ISL-54]MBT2782197.1 AraC family transcriptional regulator [Lysobacter sp. ISL-52]